MSSVVPYFVHTPHSEHMGMPVVDGSAGLAALGMHMVRLAFVKGALLPGSIEVFSEVTAFNHQTSQEGHVVLDFILPMGKLRLRDQGIC